MINKIEHKNILMKNYSSNSINSEKSEKTKNYFIQKKNNDLNLKNNFEITELDDNKIYFFKEKSVTEDFLDNKKQQNITKPEKSQIIVKTKKNDFKDTKKKKKIVKKKKKLKNKQIFDDLSSDYDKICHNSEISKNDIIQKIVQNLKEKKLNNSFPISYKKLILEMTKLFGIEKISQVTGVLKKNIKRWILKGVLRKKGAGRKITDINLENELIKWTLNNITVSGRIPKRCKIMKMARILKSDGFKASKGWCDKFLRRNKSRFFDELRVKGFNKKIIF